MSTFVDEILERISKEGFSPDEMKEAVVEMLDPFFDDKTALNEEAMSSDLLSIFSYLLIYHSDQFFSKKLIELLDVYKKAYSNNPQKLTSIILSTANLMGQKENIMWTVKSNTPKSVSGDMHEMTYSLIKHIGDVLEISARHEIAELYAVLEISLNNDLDYEVIKKRDFGVIIQTLLDKNNFEDILKTYPNNIKLSDWRNIAYHHTYEIANNKIKCFYGKKGNNFDLTLDELNKYVVTIIKSCNVIDIARRIFLFNNAKTFSSLITDDMIVREREAMRIGQLRTGLLGQGFKLVNEIIDSSYVEIILEDIESSNGTTEDHIIIRQIHCAQFLYNVWLKFPSNRISIIYSNSEERLYKYSIDGKVCEKISKDLIEFKNMYKYITIEKL